MDVPQLSFDNEVVNGTEDGEQLLLGHQREVVNHICLQQHILLACIANNNERR